MLVRLMLLELGNITMLLNSHYGHQQQDGGASGWNCNNGRLQRMMNTSFDPVNSVYGSAGAKLVNENATKAVGKNYYSSVSSNTDNVHYITATIPLKIVHDLFKKCRW